MYIDMGEDGPSIEESRILVFEILVSNGSELVRTCDTCVAGDKA